MGVSAVGDIIYTPGGYVKPFFPMCATVGAVPVVGAALAARTSSRSWIRVRAPRWDAPPFGRQERLIQPSAAALRRADAAATALAKVVTSMLRSSGMQSASPTAWAANTDA